MDYSQVIIVNEAIAADPTVVINITLVHGMIE